MAVDHFPIEAGHILLFARAIGDPNPVYADAEKAEGGKVGQVIAPPTFVQASAQFEPEYMLRPSFGKPWFGSGTNATGSNARAGGAAAGGTGDGDGGSGRASGGGGGRSAGGGIGAGLHAEQHFEYHRHLVPGDVLSATTRPGERWEKQGRSGKLVFSETITEYRDQNGELVITARGVGVQTEGPVTQSRGA